MKTWKHADFIIQCLLFTLGAAFVIFSGYDGLHVLWAYFLLGGWQILSCIVNFFWKKGQWKVADRKAYLITVFIVIGTGIVTYYTTNEWGDFIFTYLFGLLILTPLIAIWYISICYREWQLIRTKEFMHLK